MLLYVQPISRIARLTIDDVIHDADQMLLRPREPASPVPQRVTELLGARRIAASAGTTWAYYATGDHG